jgi:LmbE family N-acetylglucosaminyl deacetylase
MGIPDEWVSPMNGLEQTVSKGALLAAGARRRAAVVVAHPDDETLWLGGTIMMHPQWSWRVVSLCRGNDPDRRPRFFSAMRHLGVQAEMFQLDDGPQQRPLSDGDVQQAVRVALERATYDLIVTHSPFGEYTRHMRHEEVGRAVLQLWQAKRLTTKELWLFAYSDSGGDRYPTALEDADLVVSLPEDVWSSKLAVMRQHYGFAPDSWEALSTPRKEAFWCFCSTDKASAWQKRHASRGRLASNEGDGNEGPCSV